MGPSLAPQTRKITTAVWERLDVPGRDEASWVQHTTGYELIGNAHFREDKQDIEVRYKVRCDIAGATSLGLISTSRAGRPEKQYQIQRTGRTWKLNGLEQPDVRGLLDLDFGFTPATRLPLILRMNLDLGERREVWVARFDLKIAQLIAYPQIYRRISTNQFAFQSPSANYEATLSIEKDGFIVDYPGRWRRIG